VLEIDESEAAIVRRICRDYLAGYSARDIAIALNWERVAGPRGGVWNASTIAGSRTRCNGILQTLWRPHRLESAALRQGPGNRQAH
jgi:site-specific DNA recombinase